MDGHFTNAREVGRRLLLAGRLELQSPCHLGGGDPDATTDRPLLRDAAGRPYLPGTTLTGLLRGVLDGTRAASALFGTEWGSEGDQARLLVADARVPGTGPVPTELRDGVRIDPGRGVAEDRKKYDQELLPAGTCFEVRMQLDLYGDADRDGLLLPGLLRLMRALEDGAVVVGARGSRGLGEARMAADEDGTRWTIEDHALDALAGLQAWLGRGLQGLPDDWPRPRPARVASAAELAGRWKMASPEPVRGDRCTLELRLEVAGSLLVGSSGHGPDEADRSHLHGLRWDGAGASARPVLPGSSLAGVLRHRCLRIARTLRGGDGEGARKLVNGLFGPESVERGRPAWRSRLRVGESVIEGGRALRHTRVRIDPWTGGAAESLLFTEDAQYGGELHAKLRLDLGGGGGDPGLALLLLALRDLAGGELSVGAEAGTGRGRLRPVEGEPFAVVSNPGARVYLEPDGSARCEPEGAFERDFEALRQALETGA